jgi:F0F1-type ATP synthase assembly protein I
VAGADRRPAASSPNLVTLLGIGSGFGISVGLGVFLGVLCDDALGSSPLFALIGVAVGILVGAAGAYQVIRPYTRSNTARPRPARPDDDVRSDTR